MLVDSANLLIRAGPVDGRWQGVTSCDAGYCIDINA
jgi:hypothetical protein